MIQRAGDHCEYCGLSQAGQAATFHIDHITTIVAGSSTTVDNLALTKNHGSKAPSFRKLCDLITCVSCSLRKAARQTVEDPEKGEAAPIFNPRKKVWGEHFCWDGMRVVGLTATGRATIDALNMGSNAW